MFRNPLAWTMNFSHYIKYLALSSLGSCSMRCFDSTVSGGTGQARTDSSFLIMRGLIWTPCSFGFICESYSPAAWPTKAEWIWVAFLRIVNTSRGPPPLQLLSDWHKRNQANKPSPSGLSAPVQKWWELLSQMKQPKPKLQSSHYASRTYESATTD